MQIAYQEKTFRRKSLELIKLCNQMIADYRAQGFDLTLRQLYYQLVARDIIPNNERSYDNIGNLLSDARLAGLVDWDAIVDRTRFLRSLSHWDNPSEIIQGAAAQFNYDLWVEQERRVEVWIEKDALVGVIGGVCRQWDVPYFSCRGYTSQTEMWHAAQRIVDRYSDDGQETTILHFGDHDPSGLDMSRDIEDRLTMFCECHDTPAPEIHRLALNMDQVRQYKCPPNPAKTTDCRAEKYIRQYGNDSWELDALEPKVITALITAAIKSELDLARFEAEQKRQTDARMEISLVAVNYSRIIKFLNRKKK